MVKNVSTGNQKIDEAILFTKRQDYLRGLTLFLEVYGTEDAPPVNSAKIAGGLSYFGVCLALVQKKYKTAIDLCRRALELQFYSPDHYANLARVYVAAGNRRKAVETIESGLRQHPDEEELLTVRSSIGVRARPALPFLDRSHPINVTLGQARHARKVSEDTPRKPKG
jgi:tetratricopeptide (TPR) repeat protein